MLKTHYGDPCLHCGSAHDDVLPGPCTGDPAKAVWIAYCSLGVRHDGVEHLRFRLSDGRVEDHWIHTQWGQAFWATRGLRYDEKLAAHPTPEREGE